MSHFTVTVRVSAKTLGRHQGDVEKAVAELLAPYDEGTEDKRYLELQKGEDGEADYWCNPKAKWDWFAIGGRWHGFYPIKPGRAVHLGRPGAFNNAPEPGQSDYVTVQEIDQDAVAKKTREEAERFFTDYQALLAGKKFGALDGPRKKALRIGLITIERNADAKAPSDTVVIPWSLEVKDLKDERRTWRDICRHIDRDAFLREYIDAFNPIVTFAALDAEGWHEPGEMCWWGIHSDTPDTYLPYCRDFVSKFIKSAKPDDLLVVVDCHI